MKVIPGNRSLLDDLEADPDLQVNDVVEFETRYDELVSAFHAHFSASHRTNFVENARYHKWRYIEICKETNEGVVLDIGNDKPFLSFFLKMLSPTARISTISFDIPESPFDLHAVDIEQEPLPFPPATVDKIIFAEVLEHLWRDPAYALFQMNVVLKTGGELYLTTPNACELHAIVCALWQANPNQRNQYYETLESGHLHIWSSADLRVLVESNGFVIEDMSSFDAYRYTDRSGMVMEFARKVSPFIDLMGESLLLRARKGITPSGPVYDKRIFPDGKGVQYKGAIRSFHGKATALIS